MFNDFAEFLFNITESHRQDRHSIATHDRLSEMSNSLPVGALTDFSSIIRRLHDSSGYIGARTQEFCIERFLPLDMVIHLATYVDYFRPAYRFSINLPSYQSQQPF